MHRVILILGVLLFTTPLSALKCYKCTDPLGTGSCSEAQRDCPASEQCTTTAFRTYVGGIYVDGKGQSCASSDECDVSGSMDFGIFRILISSKCCSTDLYVQYPTLPSPSYIPNGKSRCFTCKGDDCSHILSCSGDEERCVSTRGEHRANNVTVMGCVSKSGEPVQVTGGRDSHHSRHDGRRKLL